MCEIQMAGTFVSIQPSRFVALLLICSLVAQLAIDPGFVPLLAPNRGLDERICRLESNLAHLQQVCSIQARTISGLRVQNDKYASQIKTLRRIVTKQMKNGEDREIDGNPLCSGTQKFQRATFVDLPGGDRVAKIFRFRRLPRCV
jgi:hypothetical protein